MHFSFLFLFPFLFKASCAVALHRRAATVHGRQARAPGAYHTKPKKWACVKDYYSNCSTYEKATFPGLSVSVYYVARLSSDLCLFDVLVSIIKKTWSLLCIVSVFYIITIILERFMQRSTFNKFGRYSDV